MRDTIGEYLPAKVRAVIYTVLATLIALEMIWDIVPDILEGKLVQTAAALGLGLAATQTMG